MKAGRPSASSRTSTRPASRPPIAAQAAFPIGEDDDAGAAVAVEPVEHPPERLGVNERRVAVKNEDRPIVSGERTRRLLDGMTGALLLGLECDGDIATGDGRFDLLAPLADHHHPLVGAERVDLVEQMEEQRPAGDGVEHLVGVRAHPRPLPGGEDDDGEAALVTHARAMASSHS